MKSGILKYALTFLIVLVVLFALVMVGSCSTAERPPVDSDTQLASPSGAESPDDSASTPTSDLQPTDALQTPESTATPTPVPPTPTPTPEPTAPPTVVPASDPVDDEWFSDAAFLGNSLMDGFRLFSGLTTCDYYAATSMTVVGAAGMVNSMNQQQYGKVYIELGINDIGWDPEVFKGQYAEMIDTIMEHQPDADIYIMSLTPISEYRSTTDSLFTMTRVNMYNEKLLELAEEKGCYYLDLIEALADETGYLPSAVTSDGIHFDVSHYKVWLEYVRTHHV